MKMFNIELVMKECPREWDDFLRYLGYTISDKDITKCTYTKYDNCINIELSSKYDPRPTYSKYHLRKLYDFFLTITTPIRFRIDWDTHEDDHAKFKSYFVQAWYEGKYPCLGENCCRKCMTCIVKVTSKNLIRCEELALERAFIELRDIRSVSNE